ncbi:hypothetical protein AK812_SmicGene23592 [Symbiodinium microadriaticum]|uniref:Uncharacterized protein n=1 Tax=Symbiodinium microadriaticum TaxID=2951 RepID=A0A1Q9DGX9_SYMMI|nr:hypothetical protein AK812_SmicGene23592 [Symbiodinium microadriaticum]
MIDSNSGTGFLLFYNIAEARLIKRSGGWVAGWLCGWVAGWLGGGWVAGWFDCLRRVNGKTAASKAILLLKRANTSMQSVSVAVAGRMTA